MVTACGERFRDGPPRDRLTPGDFLAEVADGLGAMDHPSADGLNTYVVSGATRRAGVKVALSGLGGDELFAGYPVFERSARLAKLNWLGSWPKGGRRMLGRMLVAMRPGMTSRKQAEILGGITSMWRTRTPCRDRCFCAQMCGGCLDQRCR